MFFMPLDDRKNFQYPIRTALIEGFIWGSDFLFLCFALTDGQIYINLVRAPRSSSSETVPTATLITLAYYLTHFRYILLIH